GTARHQFIFNYNIGEIYRKKNDPDTALQYCKAALSLAKHLKDTSDLPDLYSIIGNIYEKKSMFDSSEYYHRQGLLLAGKFELEFSKASSMVFLSLLYLKKNNYDSSFVYANKALAIFKEIKKPSKEAFTYEVLGSINRQLGRYTKALEWYLKCANLREQFNEVATLSTTYLNLGNVHWDMLNYKKAEEYYNLALEKAVQCGDNHKMAMVYQNLAAMYTENENYSDSLVLSYLMTSLQYDSAFVSPGTVSVLNTIGEIHLKYKNFSEADKYFMDFAIKSKKIDYWYGTSLAFLSLGNSQMKQQNIVSALNYFQKSLEISSEKQFIGIEVRAHKSISELYASNHPVKSLHHLNQHLLLKDSIYQLEKEKQFTEMQVKYETIKKEKEIENLTLENELNAKKLIINRTRLIATLTGLGSLVLGIIFLLYRQRQINKNAEQKRQIDVIKSNIKGQEEERHRIARELHDGVAADLLGMGKKIATRDITKDDLVISVNQIYSDTRRLSHNLLSPLWTESNLEEVVFQYIKQFEGGGFEICITRFPKEIDWRKVSIQIQNELYRITQEIISNTLKHSKAKRLDIQFMMKQDELLVSYEDNGVGLQKDYNNKGIGLRSIRNRVTYMRGSIDIDSTLGEGTLISIEIPLRRTDVTV
ncbi:MAG: tetratricopeptide repeat protein, partial [Bacteroidales bacterium]|nr:tetratricopeptide repeat protein [Bacteroidales bacterium]